MKKRSIALVFIVAVLFLPPVVFPAASARAEQPASLASAPKIARFDVNPPDRMMPGEALIFRITGTSHGNASVRIDGVSGRVLLPEVLPGIYEGAYTLKKGDRIDFDSAATGILHLGNPERSAVLSQPLIDTTAVATSRFSRRTFQ